MESIGTLLTIIVSVLGGIWSVLTTLFSIPVLGWFIQLAFYAALAWILYKLYKAMPQRAKEFTHERVAPSVYWMTRPLRWFIVTRLADPEWLGRPGNPVAKPIERTIKVPVPKRRTFGQWLASGIRWGVFYSLVFAAIWNWKSLSTLIGL